MAKAISSWTTVKFISALLLIFAITAAPSQARIIPAQEPLPAPTYTLAFAGDIHFEGVAARFARPGGLERMRSLYSDADFMMANLETAVTSRGSAQNKTYTFRAPARAVQALEEAGVTVVTMANNHALDYGRAAVSDTLAAFTDRQIGVVGIGQNDEQALTPFRTTVGEPGQELNLSVFGVTSSSMLGGLAQQWRATSVRSGIAIWDFHRRALIQAIKVEREAGRFVIVYVHWGQELNPCPTPTQQSITAALEQAGASLVVGTHPHILQPAGVTATGMPVIFSTGNFVWYHPRGGPTGVVKVKITDGRATSITLTPATIRQGMPTLDTRVRSAAERTLFKLGCSPLLSLD